MDNIISNMFLSDQGRKIFTSCEKMMAEFGVDKMLGKGVLVGFSGGADSVMLLAFLIEYRNRNYDFPIVALHVNHMIRGEEADRDELFCIEFCKACGIEIIVRRVDVPALSKERGIGIEECARDVRYYEFDSLTHSRNDVSSIFVAHNLDDNAETVIMNILRGAGTRGGGGIPRIRGNVYRPLIDVPKKDIVRLLSDNGLSFVYDSTNSSIEYSRNYVRECIIPTMERICKDPREKISAFSKSLREDDDYIGIVAREYLKNNEIPDSMSLRGLHIALFSRVITLMARNAGTTVNRVQISTIRELLSKNNFQFTLSDGYSFVCEYSACTVRKTENNFFEFRLPVKMGRNEFNRFDSVLILHCGECDNYSANVYKISIQANLGSAIIDGDLYLRNKMDGDSVYYGGITHKLKKLFNDRKIPPRLRNRIPVLCDSKGVVWVPGFGVRDDGAKSNNSLKCRLLIGKFENTLKYRFISGSEFSS